MEQILVISILSTILYLIFLLILFFYKNRMLKVYLVTNLSDTHITISMLWAWANIDDIYKFNYTLKKDTELSYHYKKSNKYLFHPINLFLIFLIIIYQVWPRKQYRNKIRRRCIYTPNCSNYSIGVLRRYDIIESIPKIRERLTSCDGSKHEYRF